MIESAIIGIVAAATAFIPKILPGNPIFNKPVFVLGVTAFAVIIQHFVLSRRSGPREYNGVADLLYHIHAPTGFDSAIRWFSHGLISLVLALFGGFAGIEGAATEFALAYAVAVRNRASRWFEGKRRTDSASALAAGITAAFGAPFAGLLLPMELEMGGRTISIGISAISSFISVRFFMSIVHLRPVDLSTILYGFRLQNLGWNEWAAILGMGAFAGVAGALIIRFIRYSQESLLDLFQRQAWMRVLAGGILLFLVAEINRGGTFPSWALLDQVLWTHQSLSELGLLFFAELLALTILLSGFGTVGIFWPLFALGAIFGSMVSLHGFSEVARFPAVLGLAGGVAFWGGVLGTPLSGAILTFELTQNLHVLIASVLAGYFAYLIRQLLRSPSLVELDLEAKGISVVDGRSNSVLEASQVKDAMVVDHEIVHEHEPVSSLYAKMLKTRYPFLPVVNSQGTYLGLLTIDMVQEAWRSQSEVNESNSSLSRLLEAKDLLYRSGLKVKSLKANDRLSASSGLFVDIPCVPVLADDGRVLGLLFVHNVRLAYDREMARRSLLMTEKV